MNRTVATAYDQNPARLALIVKNRRTPPKKPVAFMVSLLITIGAGVMWAAKYFSA